MSSALIRRFLFLCLLGGLLSTPASRAQNVPGPAITTSTFGFECTDNSTCGNLGHWITTTSQPGAVRLWNSGTNWPDLQSASGSYTWSNLDNWLDLIAQHEPMTVMYTFGNTPCFIASAPCGTAFWSSTPPADLTPSGSPTFNSFVTALVQHCSPAGNCVRTLIKNWEMWNEADETGFWTGTPLQLYQMFAPAIKIVRANVPGAMVSTPPVDGGQAAWMASWMAQENTYGRLSDQYGIHIYIRNYEPEQRMSMVAKMVSTKNSNGWTQTPWADTETNYQNTTFTCSTKFTLQDCYGQLIRWHVLLLAYQGGVGGAAYISWYNWPSINWGGYDTYYYTMMQWLAGAIFTASCANSGTVWTCPLLEPAGANGLIVWNTAGSSSYTPASQYVDYKAFNGTYGGETVPISPSQTTMIGLIPVMFETTKLH